MNFSDDTNVKSVHCGQCTSSEQRCDQKKRFVRRNLKMRTDDLDESDEMKPTAVAFFDLDKTVLSVNSGYAWLRHEWRQRRITPGKLAQGIWGLLRYSLGQADMRPVIEGAIRDYRGASAQELENAPSASSRRRYDQVRGDAHENRPHRSEGTLAFCLTSSHFLAACVVSHLKLDGALCTNWRSDRMAA